MGVPVNRSATSTASNNNNDIFDLFVVGFGPAGLAVAVALHDNPNAKHIKAHFIEKQPQFGWHLGMTIPGYKMQVSFLKDLVTMRDPTSHFSFLNYLKHRGRLVAFSNLYTFLPLREEYNDYMSWAADHFRDHVTYSSEAVSVEPYFLQENNGTVEILKVTAKDPTTGELTSYLTRNLVISTGAQPKMPDLFPADHPRVKHSSQYLFTEIPADAKHIGVVGAGQSGAEIFKHIATRFPQNETKLLVKKSALRPADISPFINELYNPDGVDYYFNLPEERQLDILGEMKNTAVGIVHEMTIADLFKHKYEQIAMGKPARHRIVPNTNIQSVKADDKGVTVRAKNRMTQEDITYNFDVLFVAVGYNRTTQVKLLEPSFKDALFPLTIRRDYSLVANDSKFKAGIYLQGMCEGSHGINDAALSVMSLRGYEVVESVVKRLAGQDWEPNQKTNLVRIGGDREDGLVWGF
ncbi:hypothetical protein FRC03_004646 [Tulasnella sp. 419]|nr:hypothetical protein FRC03_004646 [Tulasnella sp. 419]